MFFLEPVPLGTQLINFAEHPFQQCFSRDRRNSGTLKLSDLTTLTMNLGAHSLDLAPDMVKLHHALVRPKLFEAAVEQRRPDGLPA
jgi:hypothetical protein